MRSRDLPGDLTLATARGLWQRGLGLMGVESLPARTALEIPRCSSIHTFFMRFAIDLVWLDRDGAVLRVDHDVPPRRLKACRAARSVVECNAGMGDRFAAALGG